MREQHAVHRQSQVLGLLAYVAEKFLHKPLTVAYALALHTLEQWTQSRDQMLLLCTYKQPSSTNNLQSAGSNDCTSSTLVEHHFCSAESLSEGNDLGFTVIQQKRSSGGIAVTVRTSIYVA
jgi:hypothetical protein